MTRPPSSSGAVWCALGTEGHGEIALVEIDADGGVLRRESAASEHLPAAVARREREDPPRWVLPDAAAWCPSLLAAGVRIRRGHDLRLVHRLLERSELVVDPAPIRAATRWAVPFEDPAARGTGSAALFELDPATSAHGRGIPQDIGEVLAELARQRTAIDGARGAGRLRLLAAAESAGGLVAAELHAAGTPWDVDEHDRILREMLGPRPRPGQTPDAMAELAGQVREALQDPQLSLDSPPRVLRALHRAGIAAESTSRWDLEGIDHPAIPPLLRYKKLARLLTANGWTWIDDWVHEGRYRPVYVPGGVVTGRWAASGGGALQIPRLLRTALRADPGWMLVGADVAQLEPRVLAAMSGDAAMAQAGAGRDLYAGIVDTGIVTTRQEAKIAVLGALYGGTTGDSGRLVPRLRSTFPRAMGLVDQAALVGEKGGTVTTWLGRSSPAPEAEWTASQARAHQVDSPAAQQDRARRDARDRGRFTRNFVVQGTAAEWALAWIATIRRGLLDLDPVTAGRGAAGSGPALGDRAHLAYFLHDEVIVHAPAEQAEEVSRIVREAADEAGRLLFPGSPVDFPLDLVVTERAAGKD